MYTLEYNDNVHIHPEKKLQRHMIIDVQQYQCFHFCRWWRHVVNHTTVHVLGHVSGTGNWHPIPMDRIPTVSHQ